jgi:hypothetical protein
MLLHARCAQCLGVLGAIDPARVAPELPRPVPFSYTPQGCLVRLVTQHLVRVLQTASDTGQLEATSYAIQQILQHYSRQRFDQAALTMQVGCCLVPQLVTKQLHCHKRCLRQYL